ncbi:MAG: glycosyltransferase 87 family protein [Oscillospiraceae bacterium]|nr:glycosyltransferase 87 family protein [Oscillospiraceae bacterium]
METIVAVLVCLEALLAFWLLYRSGLLRSTFSVLLSALLVGAAFGLRIWCLDYETLDYQNFLRVWVDFFRQNGGLSALGMPVGNYNVPYLFFLALFSRSPIPDLYLIKLLSIFFDVVLAWAVMQLAGRFVRSPARRLACFFLVLFWPTVVLNGALWGQCDSIYTAFAVLSVWLVLAGHPALGMASIAAAFSLKLQAVFVLPVFLLFLLARRVKLWHFLFFPSVCVLMVLPAVLAGRPLWEALTISLSQTGSIGDGLNYNSSSVFALFSNVQNPALAGKLGILAAALVIVLLAILIWKRRDACSDRALLIAAVLLAAAIPFFLPHMHDRYFFAADILTLALAVVDLRLAPLPLLCEFASLLGYHAYLKLRYLLPMSYGAGALIVVLTILAAALLAALFSPDKKLRGSA